VLRATFSVSCCLFFSFIAADIARDSVSSALLDCRFLLWVVGGRRNPHRKTVGGGGSPSVNLVSGKLMEITEDAVKLSSSYGIRRTEFCLAVLKASVELLLGLKFPRISVPFLSSYQFITPPPPPSNTPPFVAIFTDFYFMSVVPCIVSQYIQTVLFFFF
jgi:hypothetical protein